MSELTIFSWGYWGWGNATRELVKAVDAVEASRGFEPPLFVDARISRSVRAVGFRDDAFQRKLGADRYEWMTGLGNRAVQTGVGTIDIKDPGAAEDLLEVALTRAKRRQRVIFYCSCEWPVWQDGNCHRVTVGSLVLEAASRRGVKVSISEWPGGSSKIVEIKLSPIDFRKARTGKTIPLTKGLPSADLLGLPWGSLAEVRSGSDVAKYFVGPATFRAGRWGLSKLADGLETTGSVERGIAAGMDWRRDWGFEPRSS